MTIAANAALDRGSSPANPSRAGDQSWPPADADHLLVTSAEMAALEERLFGSGLPVEALMEKAALAVSRRLLERLAGGAGPGPRWARQDGVVVLVGPGHNGGDGLVLARELQLAGVPVRLWCPFERLRPLTDAHLRHATWLDIPRLEAPPDAGEPALWIDALFGIGQNRPPGALLEGLLQERQQRRPGRLAAIDVPTGLCADSGRRLGQSAATAAVTWCLGLLKRGLVQDGALAHVGRLERVDLGLPPSLLAGLPAAVPLGLLSGDQLRAARPCPDPACAKYGRGRLLVVAGSPRYRGAAHLALLGASASGCGSLRALLPLELQHSLWQVLPHVVVEQPAAAAADGLVALEADAMAALEAAAEPLLEAGRLDALLIGPGLGPGDGAALPELWRRLGRFEGLLLLDADGLNRLAAGGAGEPALTWLQGRCGPTWLTPHRGEFGRLFPDFGALPPLQAAQRAAAASGACVLLKGARSVIAAADGRRWQLLEASPAVARAGLGDVLAGYAAGCGALALAAGRLDDGDLALAALDHAVAGLRSAAAGEGQATPAAVATELGLQPW